MSDENVEIVRLGNYHLAISEHCDISNRFQNHLVYDQLDVHLPSLFEFELLILAHSEDQRVYQSHIYFGVVEYCHILTELLDEKYFVFYVYMIILIGCEIETLQKRSEVLSDQFLVITIVSTQSQ